MAEENKKNQNYTNVLLEKIDSKFDFLVEESKIVKEKLETLEVKVDSLENRFGSLEIKVGSLESKTNLLVEDMDEVKGRLIIVEDNVKEINAKLDKKADEEIVHSHEKRLAKLENSVLVSA